MKRRLRNRLLPCAALLLGALGGCSKPASDEPPAATRQPTALSGVYDGALPCANCKEIAATLWLRPDERFFLRQTIIAENGEPDGSSYSFGHWRWDEVSGELVLAGRGPERRLAPLDADRLQLKSASAGAQVLARDASARPFEDRVLLEGESAISDDRGADDGGKFVQCFTGLELPIANAGAYRELRRQHRVLNRSKRVAFTTVEARFATVGTGEAAREVLVVERVVEPIKPGKGC